MAVVFDGLLLLTKPIVSGCPVEVGARILLVDPNGGVVVFDGALSLSQIDV